MSEKKRLSLGKGLDALIPQDYEQKTSITELSIDLIEVNPYQPRKEFDDESIEELASSIKSYGIIQPIVVRKINNNKYQVIAGERRVRAAKKAGLDKIPAYIREANDDDILQMALIENIHRKDLNPIEIALSYQRLISECNYTQEQLSKIIGKDRSTIANFLRLLKLPPEIQQGLKENKISFGHARALLSIEDPELQIMIYKQTLLYDFSVRKLEEIAKNINTNKTIKKSYLKKSISFLPYKKEIQDILQTTVEIKSRNENEGKIIIYFENKNKLIEIYKKLTSIKNND
ncbi:MAG: ParB/RepB/Spo0J family partition protein [Bacteroidales bacterium]|nr:ParB/RepB/Spo0J family partition protein [Bacteroidales bacterium]